MSEHENRREELLSMLRTAVGNDSINLPSALGFTMKKGAWVIEMSSKLATANLQADGAAFEGWALAIKRWLGKKERGLEVHLRWDPPADTHDLDYQRFLYRVIRFEEAAKWFKVGGCQRHLRASRVLKLDGSPRRVRDAFLVNVPGRRNEVIAPKARKIQGLTENQIEVQFYLYPQRLLDSIGWRGCIERQIPVGVFDEEINNGARVFPGAGGRVDLGALNRKEGSVALFELKKPGNTKVGVISEILFYAHVVRDIQRDVFRYRPNDKGEFEQDLYEADHAYGFVLASSLHPLLDDVAVFRLLNSAYDKYGKGFGFVRYDESLNCVQVY